MEGFLLFLVGVTFVLYVRERTNEISATYGAMLLFFGITSIMIAIFRESAHFLSYFGAGTVLSIAGYIMLRKHIPELKKKLITDLESFEDKEVQ
jgi:uncharacterized membrane protein HdeD (DUF308 family)